MQLLSSSFFLSETSDYIITQLEQKSMAVSVGYLSDFLLKLPDLKAKLLKMKTITNDLRVHASQLSDGKRFSFFVVVVVLY